MNIDKITIAIYSGVGLLLLFLYFTVTYVVKLFTQNSSVAPPLVITVQPTPTPTPTVLTLVPTTTVPTPAPTTSVPTPPSPFSNLYNVQDVSNGFSITPSTNRINIGTELGAEYGVVTNLIKPIPSSIYLWDQKPNPYTWKPYGNKINVENVETNSISYALQYTFNGTLNIGGINFSNGLVGNPNNDFNWSGYNSSYNFSKIGVYLLRNNTISTLLFKSISNNNQSGKLRTIYLVNPVIVNAGDKIFITLYVDTGGNVLALGNLYFEPYVKPTSPNVLDVSYGFTMDPISNTINIGSETSLDSNFYGGATASNLINLTKQTQINWNVSCNYKQDNNYIKISDITPALQCSFALQYIFPDNTSITNILIKNGNLQPNQSWGVAPQYYPSRMYVYLLRNGQITNGQITNGQITNILTNTSDLPKNDTLTTIPLTSKITVNSTDKIFVCLYNDNDDGTGRKWIYGMSLKLLYFT